MKTKSEASRSRTYYFIILSILSAALSAKAQIASEDLSLFGTLAQGDPGITVVNGLNIQPNACAPTAVLDGLIYLENYVKNDLPGVADPFNINQNNIANDNTLATDMGTEDNNFTIVTNAGGKRFFYKNLKNPPAPGTKVGPGKAYTVVGTDKNVGGTSPAGIQSGLGIYLNQVNTTAPLISYGQNDDPTAAYLAKVLDNKDAIEVGITWATYNPITKKFTATGGAHFLTLQSINMTTGKISLIDPWGATGPGSAPGDAANLVTANISVKNGLLYVTGLFGDDGDTIGRGSLYGAGGQNLSGVITLDEVETLPGTLLPTPVPEASTLLAGAMLLLPFGVSYLRKLRSTRLAG